MYIDEKTKRHGVIQDDDIGAVPGGSKRRRTRRKTRKTKKYKKIRKSRKRKTRKSKRKN